MSPTASENEQKTNAFLIELSLSPRFEAKCEYTVNQPTASPSNKQDMIEQKDGPISLFCSGHSLLSDGSLFVVGGHIKDFLGLQSACVYDYRTNRWTVKEPGEHGRWYPTALTMPDSSVLVMSGKDEKDTLVVRSEIWRGDRFDTKIVPSPTGAPLPLYPRLHLDPWGKVFMTGPLEQGLFLDMTAIPDKATIGKWIEADAGQRRKAASENGASVTYDVGKILWVGGGNGKPRIPGIGGPGSIVTEIINLNDPSPKWSTDPKWNMNFPRRHHNLTVLPDGKVLATGGTRGDGFNDLRPGEPVHEAELWDPVTKVWTVMAAENTDRCYHGVALLLPDGSVLSAGSGEGGEAEPNPPPFHPARTNHTDAQIYRPPYFFIGGSPPKVTGALDEVRYGQSFDVTVQSNDTIGRISWIRLPSVTHGLNSSQSVYFDKPKNVKGNKFTVTTPNNRNVATPGHYMLFFVNTQGRPSEANIVKISTAFSSDERVPERKTPAQDSSKPVKRMMVQTVMSLPELNDHVISKQERHPVKLGLTPVCPYGLASCWAGAFEALQKIDDIGAVRPLPDGANSVGYVYLKDDILPDVDVWRDELRKTAGWTYGKCWPCAKRTHTVLSLLRAVSLMLSTLTLDLRGLELTLSGSVVRRKGDGQDQLVMLNTATRPEVILAPFYADSVLERDHQAGVLKPVTDAELSAYGSLLAAVAVDTDGHKLRVTGRVHRRDEKNFELDVREWLVEEQAE